MSVRLFVGNLPYDTTESDLKEFFAPVGPLSTVIIPVDRETGKRRGFAFVEFSDPAQAAEASRRLNNQPFKGRNITINEARARESRPDSGPGARPGGPMRPTFGPRPTRPGFSPRPSVGSTDFSTDPLENERSARAERRSRSFGAFGNKGEMVGKNGPLRERGGGQIFGGYDDDDYDDGSEDLDYLADFKESDEEGAV
jgi:RNA recognition motif-containing protein